MRKIQIFLLLFFLFIPSLAAAQTSGFVNTAANKSWSKFWAEFRATTVQLRIARVISNADVINEPVTKTNIVVLAKGERFSRLTNNRGIAFFEAVPCGEGITIVVYDEDEKKDVEMHYNLTCQLRPVSLTVEKFNGGPPELKQGIPRYTAGYLDRWHRQRY